MAHTNSKMIEKKKYEALRMIKEAGGMSIAEFAIAYYGDKSKKRWARKILENLAAERLARDPYDPEEFVVSNLGLEKMAEFEANYSQNNTPQPKKKRGYE